MSTALGRSVLVGSLVTPAAPVASQAPGPLAPGWIDREVAIKVLPAAVAADPKRLARFEREAVSGLRTLITAANGTLVYSYSRARTQLYVIRGLQ